MHGWRAANPGMPVVRVFFDDHLAKGLGDMIISIVGLLLAFWLVHFLYKRKIFLRL